MPNDHEQREFGPHKYNEHGTGDCHYRCGCWAGEFHSGGPLGLDPIHGKCPNNPLDEERREGNTDHEDVVNQRIQELIQRTTCAEAELKRVELDKKQLANELQKMKENYAQYMALLDRFLRGIEQLQKK